MANNTKIDRWCKNLANGMPEKEKVAEMIKKFQQNPVMFTELVLGDKLWQKQKDIIRATQHSNVTVGSCHAAGKSFISSRTVIHKLSLFPNTQIITTAPTDRQVKNVLWKEIRDGWNNSKVKLGGATPLTKSVKLDDKWFALGFATNNANTFQGFHGDRILVIVDEAAGVEEDIFEGIEGVTSSANAHKLYIGNPTTRSGSFYESHKSPDYVKFSISAFETPNFTAFNIDEQDIINDNWRDKIKEAADISGELTDKKMNEELPYPQLVTPKWVRQRYLSWGPESALYVAKVKGRFPEAEEYTIIPVYMWKQSQIDPAKIQLSDITVDDVQVGVDVARFGSDTSSVAVNVGNKLVELKTLSKMDTTEVAEFTSDVIRDMFSKLSDWKDIVINVDVGGVGAGVADHLRNVKRFENVVDIQFGAKANESTKFLNRRSEMHWNLREGLKDGVYKVAVHDEDLENQITTIRYEFTSKDKIKLEAKDKIKKRLGRSPDESDSVCLAFYDAGKSKSTTFSAWKR